MFTNSFMDTVCSHDDSKCTFVDTVSKVDWEPDNFLDCGHFSRKGGMKFAKNISQVILSKATQGKLYNR